MSLRYLFDAELQYRADAPPVAVTGEGRLIGSGGGTVRGTDLEGTIRWTLFEQPGELACAMNPVLVVETADGAEVTIEARGYARRESRADSRWRVAATLLFATRDERYRSLDGALGVWEGEFDAETHRARYRAYATAKPTRTLPSATFTRPEEWRAGRERLDAGERLLYREILLAFARGEWPTRATLTAERDVDAALALERLEELDLVRTDSATGQIVVAYPFSGRATAHRLELESGRAAYAMCAVDALGVAPMLGAPVLVRSRDPISSEEIVVDVSPDGSARWLPEEAVVFVGGRDGEQSISDLCCPVVNFFASHDTASQYADSHPELAGAIVGVPDALARGRLIFGEALR